MDKTNKRTITCILMTVVVCIISFLFYFDDLANLWNNALYSRGTTEYYLLSATENADLWALGRDGNDNYVLAEGNNGKPGWINDIKVDSLPERILIQDLYAVSETDALLKFCKIDETGMQEAWQLYLISDKGRKLTPLLNVSCTGTTPMERQNSVVFGSFIQSQRKVFFVVWKNGTAFSYELATDTGELRMTLSFQCDSFRDAIVLSGNEVFVVNGEGGITVYSDVGVPKYDIRTETAITRVFGTSNGFYYFDSVSGTVNHVMEQDGEFYLVQKVPVEIESVMTVQEDGTVYYINDGRLYQYNGTRTDVSEILYGKSWVSRLVLIVWFLVCLVVGYILSGAVAGRKQISILAKAALFVVLFFLVILGTGKAFLLPLQEKSVLRISQQNLETTTGMGLRMTQESADGSVNNPALHTWQALADAGFYDSSITLYKYDENGFKVLDAINTTAEKGSVVSGGNLLLSAPSSGTVSEIRETLNGPVCSCVSSDGIMLFEVNANLSAIRLDETQKNRDILLIIVFMTCLLLILVFGIVLITWFSVRNITNGVYSITEGNYDVVINNPTGDELEGLATSINNLTLVLKKNQESFNNMENRYRRFLPNGMLSLLPGDGIESIGLDSHASYDFLMMSIEIRKTDTLNNPLNAKDTMIEIDKILSEIIRLAEEQKAISLGVGSGTNLLAFEKGSLESALMLAISLRESLAKVNEERTVRGLEPMELNLIIDYGHTDIGIVGVPEQVYAVALSDRKEHFERLHALQQIMDVSMLVTGTALAGSDAEDCRYLGTYEFREGVEKIYEVFSGDDFLLARRKRETREEFRKGVDAYYRREFTEAKRIFLELVRSGSSKDGAVRYYLNHSDSYEKVPPENLGLQNVLIASVTEPGKKG